MIESVASVSSAAVNGPVSSTTPSEPSAFNVQRFEDIYHATSAQGSGPVMPSEPASGFAQALESLRSLDGTLQSLGVDSLNVSTSEVNLTPGLMLDITVKAQEFLFQSQLTATVANKTSDGITQLFRQQG